MTRQARDELLSHHPGRTQYPDFYRVHLITPGAHPRPFSILDGLFGLFGLFGPFGPFGLFGPFGPFGPFGLK